MPALESVVETVRRFHLCLYFHLPSDLVYINQLLNSDLESKHVHELLYREAREDTKDRAKDVPGMSSPSGSFLTILESS